MRTNLYGQVDFLCLQRCWIFHRLLSAGRRWLKSPLDVIVRWPQFSPDLGAIPSRCQRSAEMQVERQNSLLLLFLLIPMYMPDFIDSHATGDVPQCNSTHIWHPSLGVSRCCHFHGNKEIKISVLLQTQNITKVQYKRVISSRYWSVAKHWFHFCTHLFATCLHCHIK